MTDARDEPMADSHIDEAHLPLSQDELRALELYDRLQELTLEMAILNAQSNHPSKQSKSRIPTRDDDGDDDDADADEDADGVEDEDEDEDELNAQNALLDARARYYLRRDVIEAVMMATPVLKAVHHSTQASAVERDLLPLVQKRDEATIAVAASAAEVSALREDMTRSRVEASRLTGENKALAARLLELAGRTARKGAVRIDDPETRKELESLEQDVKAGRRRWRVMKGVASGIIAGSGVDWAGDDTLREIVLDPESEEYQ